MIAIFPIFHLLACGNPIDPDSDLDGISDVGEMNIGTDPSKADSDNDGLSDTEEVYGTHTDPVVSDSDADGLNDGDEVELGLDPLDPSSAGYELGWPQTPESKKDALADGVRPMWPTIGAPIPRVDLLDLAGEWFDLYDFALHDTPLLIFVGGAAYAGSAVREARGVPTGIPAPNRDVVADISAGDLAFATVSSVGTVETNDEPTDLETLVEICGDAGSLGCFADPTWGLWSFIGADPYGAWLLVDENMVLLAYVAPGNDPFADFSDLEAVAATLRAQRDP